MFQTHKNKIIWTKSKIDIFLESTKYLNSEIPYNN